MSLAKNKNSKYPLKEYLPLIKIVETGCDLQTVLHIVIIIQSLIEHLICEQLIHEHGS